MSDVVVVGCGYVGLELGRQLRDLGYSVAGVRRSDDGLAAVDDADLTPVRADVTDPESLTALPDADHVVFAASSGGRGAEAARRVYVDGLERVVREYGDRESTPDRLVYTSTTGVYGDHGGGWVDEETPIEPTTEKTRALAEAERVALETAADVGMDGTVVRFAGLYGPGRYRLERYVDGPVTAGYLNMIHRADAAGAVRFVLHEDLLRDDVLLAVDDEPVDKHAFADWLADECDVDRPDKRSKEDRLADADLSEVTKRRILTSKRCSNDRLRRLGFTYAYQTFREGYADAVDAYRTAR